jgi:hypothetical protein
VANSPGIYSAPMPGGRPPPGAIWQKLACERGPSRAWRSERSWSLATIFGRPVCLDCLGYLRSSERRIAGYFPDSGRSPRNPATRRTRSRCPVATVVWLALLLLSRDRRLLVRVWKHKSKVVKGSSVGPPDSRFRDGGLRRWMGRGYLRSAAISRYMLSTRRICTASPRDRRSDIGASRPRSAPAGRSTRVDSDRSPDGRRETRTYHRQHRQALGRCRIVPCDPGGDFTYVLLRDRSEGIPCHVCGFT